MYLAKIEDEHAMTTVANLTCTKAAAAQPAGNVGPRKREESECELEQNVDTALSFLAAWVPAAFLIRPIDMPRQNTS
jgi:hypothetical protein